MAEGTAVMVEAERGAPNEWLFPVGLRSVGEAPDQLRSRSVRTAIGHPLADDRQHRHLAGTGCVRHPQS
jgi:hypothetical protein